MKLAKCTKKSEIFVLIGPCKVEQNVDLKKFVSLVELDRKQEDQGAP